MLIWLVFTVSLSVWWFIFGLRQLELITLSGLSSTEELVRGQHMLLWEGLTLVVSLVIGAFAFFMLARKEMKESESVQKFLMTYTHELKTPIASLRLQTQELKDRLANSKEQVLLERLVTDTSRLTLQLDNSLFLASVDAESAVPEDLVFSELILFLQEDWPGLKISVVNDAVLKADKRILLSILRNIIHNAVAHGKARNINFSLAQDLEYVSLLATDDGRGFSGDIKLVGRLFQRHYPGSGSGIGLYLIRRLTSVLGGLSSFEISDNKFIVKLKIPGILLNG